MYQIKVTIINSLGNFKGFLEVKEEASFEDISELVDGLQRNINGLREITITIDDGSELSFNKGVLEHSIIGFKIEEL